MIFLLLAAAGFLVWYLVKHQSEKPVWAWVGLAVVAIGLVCTGRGGWGYGMMGGRFARGGMMGPGQGGRGMMGPGNGGWGMMGPRQGQGGPGMMNPNHMGRGFVGHLSGPWVWVAMGVWALIVVTVIIVAVVLIRRAVKWYNAKNSPLGILQSRLAKGEITAEEFDTLRSKLQG